MKDYKKFLNSYYQTFPTVTPIHIFSCKKSDMTDKTIPISLKESNVDGALKIKFSVVKQGFKGRSLFRKGNSGLLDAIKSRPNLMKNYTIEVLPPPGMNPYKVVEMHKNYAPNIPEKYRSETCPLPSKEILDFVKNEKKTRKDFREDKKKKTKILREKQDQKIKVKELDYTQVNIDKLLEQII